MGQRGLHVGQPVIPAQRLHFMPPGLTRLAAVTGRIALDPVTAKEAHAIRNGSIIRRHRPALAGGERLDRMEGKGRGETVTAGADGCAAILRPDCMAGILDQNGACLGGQPGHARNILALSGEMDREDRFYRPPGPLDRSGQRSGRHQPGVGIHIGKNHVGPAIARRIRGRHEGHGGNNADIARLCTRRRQCQMKRGRPVGTGHGMLHLDGFGKSGLEPVDRRSCRQPVATQHLGHGLDIALVDRLATIGQEWI